MIEQYEQHGAIVFLYSFVLTWSVGIIPPFLIRFVILKKQLSKKMAIFLSVFFFFFNVILFTVLGSETQVHSALFFIGLLSYLMYMYKRKTPDEKKQERAKRVAFLEKKRKNAKDWDNA